MHTHTKTNTGTVYVCRCHRWRAPYCSEISQRLTLWTIDPTKSWADRLRGWLTDSFVFVIKQQHAQFTTPEYEFKKERTSVHVEHIYPHESICACDKEITAFPLEADGILTLSVTANWAEPALSL